MEEKIEKLYQEYLNGKLDLIFNGENGTIFENNISKISKPFDKIYNFKNGYARVIKNGKYSFIDTNGKLISEEWYDDVENFENGYARVIKNGKYNFIDTNGKLVSEEWYESHDEYAYINVKKINGLTVDVVHDNYAVVKKNGTYNFIGVNGKLISKEWYDDVDNFENGYARVKKNGKYNFIDTSGKLISKEWYDLVFDFENGYAKVEKNGMYNFIDTSGKLISKEWYDLVLDFENGYAPVEKNGKYNFIDINGKLISEEWYDDVENFENGYAKVEKNGMYNFIDTNGKLISEEWYDYCVMYFENGYAKVRKNGKYNFIDTNGKLVSEKFARKSIKIISQNFVIVDDIISCSKIDMQDYQVKKTLLGYQCINSTDKYNLKYQPIKRFGFRYILCLKKDIVCLYDRINNNYKDIGTIYDIEYDDNFIFDKKNRRIYLIYENQIIDVTDYYNEKLILKKEISISSGVTGILSREEFSFKNMQEIDKLIQEEKERNKAIKEAQEREKQVKKLRKVQEEEKESERIRRETELKALKQLQEALSMLQQVTSPSNKTTKMRYDNIFIQVENHLEIPTIVLSILRYIDLSSIKFDNVKVDGIDFRGCNIDLLNPQKVYKKDLRNCNFEGIFIKPFTDYTDVDIRGCTFSTDNDPKTLDVFNQTFKNAIYDETTTYNGISFVKIFGESVKNNIK